MIELNLNGGIHHAAVLLGGLVVSLAVYTIGTVVYRVWLHPLSKIPGPKLLAASDVFNMYTSNVSLNMTSYTIDLHRKYGPMVRIGPNRLIVDANIAFTQVHGLRNTTESTEFSKVPGAMFPDDHICIVGAKREVHRRQRRQIAHAFSSTALHEQEIIINGYISRLMSEIESRARQDKTMNIVSWFNYCAFDIIGDLAFGDAFGNLEGDTTFVDNAFRGLIGSALMRFMRAFPLLQVPLTLILGSEETAISKAASRRNTMLGRDKARARIAMDDKVKESGRRDFATYMLRRDKNGEEVLSEKEIQINSQILVVAGSETIATALSGAIFLLSRPANAGKFRTLVDEIRAMYDDGGQGDAAAAIHIASTARLEYLHAVIEEVLRMYPPTASLSPRQSPGAEVNGHWLPRGTIIQYFLVASFRDSAYFKDPDTFVPERWLTSSHPLYDARYDSDRKDIFKPFSMGPHDCIGKNLGYAEMRVIIARLLYSFDIEVLPGQDGWMNKQLSTPIIRIKDGLEIRPMLRKGLMNTGKT
ncbi:aspirochlorine biosynthesis cytochrome P450 monooxygenase [Microdochium nivale]|nr:aspirochlorine biosynthesis cytochrome P450 monooxygenase [Microdochium nivale]